MRTKDVQSVKLNWWSLRSRNGCQAASEGMQNFADRSVVGILAVDVCEPGAGIDEQAFHQSGLSRW